MQIGELAINFYDGHLFAERDTQGVGIGTTVALLTPWVENFGGGSINYNGIVTATTYHGNQVIGTPAGGFKSGAFTISSTDHTKDSINELNFILGKLVPAAPDTLMVYHYLLQEQQVHGICVRDLHQRITQVDQHHQQEHNILKKYR